jgi:hypothetical protein
MSLHGIVQECLFAGRVCRPGSERKERTMTTRQAGLGVSDAQAYRDKMFRLLGERKPLEVLGETGSRLADIVHRHPAAVLRARPFAGKWTPAEVIGHLVDSEWVYGYRLRLMLCEDNPTILGINQDSWVAGQRHDQREPSELVDTFRALRQLNLALWQRLSPAELERTGQHNERGAESLGVVLRMLAGHDLSHLSQIARYVEAVRTQA